MREMGVGAILATDEGRRKARDFPPSNPLKVWVMKEGVGAGLDGVVDVLSVAEVVADTEGRDAAG